MKKIVLEKSVVNEILKLYNDEMLGSPAISKKLNINKQVVLRTLKENGTNVGPSGRKYKGGKSESDKRHYIKNRENRLRYFSKWQKENREHLNEYHQKWRENNIDRHRKNKRDYERTRKANDPLYKLISNFRTAIYQVLKENNVECRPLVCGSIGLQPFWKNLYGEVSFDFADNVHNYGLYLPNNQDITEEEIAFICDIVNKHTK